MAGFIYTLCVLTCLVAALLLFRGWRQTRTPLLLWSALCFAGLTLSNLILVLDRIVFIKADLSTARLATAFCALLLLIIGLIWESD
ncbi:MAG TPA: DUF5985 family protein [Usitatibacter sp.]|jgi:hypothetical protein|nr:DUF5985 family protein [Usitatibacter sp.]